MSPLHGATSAVDLLTAALLPHVVEGKAAAAGAYMKTTQPFLGVQVPTVRRIARAMAKGMDAATRLEMASELWECATHREHWYAAQEICAAPPCHGDLDFLGLYEQMILTGAWWDVVDGISRHIGLLLLTHPVAMGTILRDWSTDSFMWKRRASLTCQLQLRTETDTALLGHALDANISDPEFFIRKALGWSLRQYAKTDPDWVHDWVSRHRELMSPLSLREALRHLG